jgi:hypothetical protein
LQFFHTNIWYNGTTLYAFVFCSRQGQPSVLFFLTLVVLALGLSGCGLPSSAPPSSGSGVEAGGEETVVLNMQALDGPIDSARVRLVSLQKGVLGQPVFTQAGGEARIELPKSVFESLNDEDLLYLYVDSVENTKVRTNSGLGISKSLVPGQVKLRSYLPRAKVLKSRIPLFKPLDLDPEVNSSATVSHFSNARVVILEQQLKKNGIISKPLTPESEAAVKFNTAILDTLSGTLDTIKTQLENPASATTAKFRLLATATKAIIERDINTILLLPTTAWQLENSDEILLELAENSAENVNAFHPIFDLEFSSLSVEITRDLTNPELTNSVGSALALNGLLGLSDTDIREALDSDLIITPIDSNQPSISATTPITGSIHFLLPARRMSDGDALLQLEPIIPAAKASFAVEKLINQVQTP